MTPDTEVELKRSAKGSTLELVTLVTLINIYILNIS